MPLISLVVSTAITIAVVELLLRLPLVHGARQMLSLSRRAAAVMSSRRISEHWKEQALLKYSVRLAGTTFRLLLIFALLGAVVVVLAGTADFFLHPAIPSLAFLASWPGLATATVASVVYLVLRSRFGAK